jgi:hypothetical protein
MAKIGGNKKSSVKLPSFFNKIELSFYCFDILEGYLAPLIIKNDI